MKDSHQSIIDTNFLSVYSLRNFISKYAINLFRSRSLVRSLAQSPFLYLSIYRSVFLFLPIFFLGLFLFPFCSRCLFSSHYATARRRILSFTRSPFHYLSLFLSLRAMFRTAHVCMCVDIYEMCIRIIGTEKRDASAPWLYRIYHAS